jgi:hypothetical protein
MTFNGAELAAGYPTPLQPARNRTSRQTGSARGLVQDGALACRTAGRLARRVNARPAGHELEG